MFGIFKKKNFWDNKLDDSNKEFIKIISLSLFKLYPLIKKQLDDNVIIGIVKNPTGGLYSYTYAMDNAKFNEISDKTQGNIMVKNIRFQTKSGEKTFLDVYISNGLLMGFFAKMNIQNLILDSIDVSSIWEKHFIDEDLQFINKFLVEIDKRSLKKLNLYPNPFKIRLNDKDFYAIHQLFDGNYYVLDVKGKVYKLIHDPFVIEEKFSNVKDFILSLK